MKLRWFAGLFCLSGLAGLIYEVIWLRLAMAAYGVTTPLVSIVLSVFMAGLGLGSWWAGLFTAAIPEGPVGAARALRYYALSEAVIAIGGTAVPFLLRHGSDVVEAAAHGAPSDSAAYYVVSGLCITVALLPFCIAMGATFPFAMAAIRRALGTDSDRSFSFLYLANLIGATAGTLLSAYIFIEVFGLHGTGSFAVVINVLCAVTAFAVSYLAIPPAILPTTSPATEGVLDRRCLAFLFATGLTSMAMEVTWIRQYAPFLGNVVYAFAAILATYLAASALGSRLWRFTARRFTLSNTGWSLVWIAAAATGVLPLLATDPRLAHEFGRNYSWLRLILGIGPFCATLGFLTPMLVDRYSGGDAKRGGSAYAYNVVGCILGPLLASFALLPWAGERWTLALLALTLFACGLLVPGRAVARWNAARPFQRSVSLMLLAGAVAIVFMTVDFDAALENPVIRRDHTATTVAAGRGMERRLYVNGISMTVLSPVTKMMAHLPAAYRATPPSAALDICFGMGTTFRSLLAWNADTTVVELIPAVPKLFGFFHSDAAQILGNPHAHIKVDDGRRFLEHTEEQFDVITIDPPPPIEAAGSSLLYSREFYELAKKRLRPGGILQQWLWLEGMEPLVAASTLKALTSSFRSVRTLVAGRNVGLHVLASMDPIPSLSPEELAARLPPAVIADMLEWGPQHDAVKQLKMYFREVDLRRFILVPDAPAMEDDLPLNEYFFFRRLLEPEASLTLLSQKR